MKRRTSISAYSMGWIVAAAVSTLFCLLLAARMFAYEALCRPDELCLREWVSALSGIIGVVVAFSSLAYVAKQIEQASRHHRDAMRVQLQRTRAVARRARASAQTVRNLGSSLLQARMTSNRLGTWGFSGQISTLSEGLSDPAFRAFEQEIDLIGTGTVEELSEALRKLSASVQERRFTFGASSMQPTEHDVQEASFIAIGAIRYAEEIIARADEFIRESDELVGN